MPPPVSIPKNMPKPVCTIQQKVGPKRSTNKIFKCNDASKLSSISSDTITRGCNIPFTNTKPPQVGNTHSKTQSSVPVTVHKKLRCFVPEKDIHCCLTNNTHLDEATKKLVRYQISNKIYNSGKTIMKMTPTKCSETLKGVDVKDLEVTAEIKSSGLKFGQEPFKKKKMHIDEIDVDSLKTPMRCSTPTPSLDASTIVAGHLDYSIEETQAESTEVPEPTSSEEMLMKFVNVPSRPKPIVPVDTKPDEKNMEKLEYCKDWVENESGISSTNSDVPPSLYASTVNMSDSLLDITSVSRNVQYPKSQTKGEETKNRANDRFDSYKNTVFM